VTDSRRVQLTGVPWARRAPLLGDRLLAACGIAGPAAFTAAWVISSLRQPGYGAGQVQLSGLASLEARDPQIMMAGFIGLGVCSVAFGTALGRVTAPDRAGAWLVRTAGAAVVAAGLFRRDHILLTGPGFGGESWHNQVHDAVSGVAYVTMIAAPLVLARRFRRDPDWAGLSRPLEVITLTSGAALVLFASQAVEPWNAVLQRFAVTLPLTAEALMAARMLAEPMRMRRAGRLSWKARGTSRRD
jgi:hypothetical membrane protein